MNVSAFVVVTPGSRSRQSVASLSLPRHSRVRAIGSSIRRSTEADLLTGLTPHQMRVAKLALMSRYFQHTVAAYFGINQGRISEFKNSAMFRKVPPASALPAGFPPRR